MAVDLDEKNPETASAEATSMASSRHWAHELEVACTPLHYLCVTDVTDGHAVEGAKDGRALRADGRDIKVLIISTRFRGASVRERQEIVNAVLYQSIKSGALHSVQMRCWDPDEWAQKGLPVDLGAPCSYSSTGGNEDYALELGPQLVLPSCTADEAPKELPPAPLVLDAEPAREVKVREASVPEAKLCACGAEPLLPAQHEPGPAQPEPSPLPALPRPEKAKRRIEEARKIEDVVHRGGRLNKYTTTRYLRAQGIRGLETAQAILKCEDASKGSREAALQFLAEQVVRAGDW